MDIFRRKRVLITGHTGFKGSWLSAYLSQLGANIIGISDRVPTDPAHYDLIKGIIKQDHCVDVRDQEAVFSIIEDVKPRFVFHLAAQPIVLESYEDPLTTFSTNALGTANILDALRRSNNECTAVMITSDKCYDNVEWTYGYRETDRLGGKDPYSGSKGAAELVIKSYVESFFKKPESNVQVAVGRAGNVIGGGDWAEDRLIPDILKAFQKHQPVCVRYPNAVRPWQHVLEPLSGYMKLAEMLYSEGTRYGKAWNFGPSDMDAKPVITVVQKMVELWGEDASWILDDGGYPSEANYLKLDCSKAHTKLLWRPKWNLNMALEKVIEWNKETNDNGKYRRCCVQQIDEYMT